MGESRRRGERRTASRHRWQGVHPVTGERWSLSARTAGDLAELVARARRIGHELRAGRVTLESAIAQCDELARGRVAVARLITIEDAWRAYEATIVHPHTRSKLRSVWKHHLAPLASVAVASLTDARCAELVATWARAGLSPKYIRNSLWAFLSAAIHHAKRARAIERLPWDDFVPPRGTVRRKPAAAERVDQLVAILDVARADDAIRDARGELGDMHRRVGVLALCGMRNGEGAGLGWDHVDFDADTITIAVQAIDQWRTHFPDKRRPDFPTKNAKVDGPLVQRMHPDVRAMLLAQRDALRARGWYRPDGPVFPARGGEWRKNANCIYPEDARELAVRAGVPNAARWVTHSLRHTSATLELRYSGAPRDVQKRMGHASLRMLDQYVHGGNVAPSAIPSVLRRAGPMAGAVALAGAAAGKTLDEGTPP